MKSSLTPIPMEIFSLKRGGTDGTSVIAEVFDLEARLLMIEGSRVSVRLPGTNWKIGEKFQIVIEKIE